MNAASALTERNNKEARRERDRRRAAAGGGSRGSFDAGTKRELFRKQNATCPCCFQPILNPLLAEVDHAVPLARGGANDSSNIILTHAQCNREKKDKTLLEHWEWRVKVGLDNENLGRKYGLVT
jgi:5-methylcytosine-specific restriction endonuclease McrA